MQINWAKRKRERHDYPFDSPIWSSLCRVPLSVPPLQTEYLLYTWDYLPTTQIIEHKEWHHQWYSSLCRRSFPYPKSSRSYVRVCVLRSTFRSTFRGFDTEASKRTYQIDLSVNYPTPFFPAANAWLCICMPAPCAGHGVGLGLGRMVDPGEYTGQLGDDVGGGFYNLSMFHLVSYSTLLVACIGEKGEVYAGHCHCIFYYGRHWRQAAWLFFDLNNWRYCSLAGRVYSRKIECRKLKVGLLLGESTPFGRSIFTYAPFFPFSDRKVLPDSDKAKHQ